ncbi:MAG TPA: O-antigen ligase family protein [Terriglobales bacterium]|nr:O-antigen ligase family protein [Terriglobales bacterium]
MEQSKSRALPERGEGVTRIVTSEKLWYLLLIFVSLVSGAFLLFIPRPEIMPAIALALIIGITFFFYPYLGVLAYIILSYMRFEETIPALGHLHLAKLLTVTLIVVWVLKTGITKSRLYLQENGLILLYLFYLVMVFSIPFSYWPSRSLDIFVEMLKILVFTILFIHLISTTKKLKTFFWIFLLVNGYLALSAIKNFLVLGQAAVASRVGGSGGFLGDANDFALALSIALPFAFYLFLAEKKKNLKLIYFLFISLYTLGIISTASRGGFITLVFLFLYFIFKSKHKLVGVFSVLLIFLMIFFFAPKEYWQRQMTITTYQQDESAMGRIGAWKAGIRMFADRPLTGVGVGVYEVAYGVKYGGKSGPWFSPHNAYVEVGAELGFFGIILYLGLMLYVYTLANSLIKSFREENYLKWISQGLKGALLAYAVGSFFLSVGLYPHLYLLLGMVIVIGILKSEQKKEICQET